MPIHKRVCTPLILVGRLLETRNVNPGTLQTMVKYGYLCEQRYTSPTVLQLHAAIMVFPVKMIGSSVLHLSSLSLFLEQMTYRIEPHPNCQLISMDQFQKYNTHWQLFCFGACTNKTILNWVVDTQHYRQARWAVELHDVITWHVPIKCNGKENKRIQQTPMSMMGIPAAVSGLCKWVKYILQSCNVVAIFFSTWLLCIWDLQICHARMCQNVIFQAQFLLLNARFLSPLPLV